MNARNTCLAIASVVLLANPLITGCAVTPPPEQSAAAPLLRLASLFSDNMVLQRDMPIKVWGWAALGSPVSVTVAGRSAQVMPDATGAWEAVLPAASAGGPYTLTAVQKNDVLAFENVMIGDVWVCSGQSNMAWPVDSGILRVDNTAEERANAHWPRIRLLSVTPSGSETPLDEADTTGWHVCGPETVGRFSGVAYFFGRELHKHTDIPLGLIQTAYGGTAAEAWVSKAGLRTLPDFAELLGRLEENPAIRSRVARAFENDLAAWKSQLNESDTGYEDGQPVWAATDMDDCDWDAITLPSYWEDAGYPDLDGLMWFRRDVNLAPAMANRPLRLHLCYINDRVQLWFNGHPIVKWALNEQPAGGFAIPAELARPGSNVIAIRMFDMGNKGGFFGDASDLWLRLGTGTNSPTISLAGPWKCRPGFYMDKETFPPLPRPTLLAPGNPNFPCNKYNAMIAPLTRFPIKGAVWYQGEANAKRAYEYRSLLHALIADWRALWGQGDFPFLVVQLPNFGADADKPGDAAWAEMREAQAMALELPNTGMAVTIDLGNPRDIHPTNKQDVGARLALVARHVAYGEAITTYTGPTFAGAAIEGDRIRVRFTQTGEGLVVKDGGPLKGFAIAGEDRDFVWADAVIDGDTVLVSSEQVPHPVAVRYAWANDPECNLYNTEGLPATTFRTDDWPGITANNKLELPVFD